MGAWGVGMQANDSALDAIHTFERYQIAMSKLPEQVKSLFDFLKTKRCCYCSWAVLGLAEAVHDAGGDLSLVREEVDKYLQEELSEEKLEDWEDPDEREAALHRFQDQIGGRPFSQEEVDLDNEGLFSKMAREDD